jgi:hypothetical protein
MSKKPPCPGNPEDYIFVKTIEGGNWRKKRGTVKQAKLNEAYKASRNNTKIVSPAARKVRAALEPYMRGIQPGRLNVRIGTAFRKSLKNNGGLQLHFLKGLELQRDHPMDQLLISQFSVRVEKGDVRVEIPIHPRCVKPFNDLVTDYYFEAVLLYGDVNEEHGLRTESVESRLYSYYSEETTTCIMELSLPEEKEWCLLLKISSLEGKEVAVHPRHYRMKVVEAVPDHPPRL